MKRRILAMLLAIVMVFGMLPMQALADEGLLEESAAETLIEETEALDVETEAPAEEGAAPEEETEATIEETEPPTTTPEDTWPQVVSDQNITNIMLVGKNYREDEPNKLSDTMLLCSINRETNTMTMVSFLRDLYVPLPAYAGHSSGRNRINVCYALGSTWKRSSEGGMEMLCL